MRRGAAELVAGIIDQVEDRSPRAGRPPMPTIKVVEALRFFLREGVQWRGNPNLLGGKSRASGGR